MSAAPDRSPEGAFHSATAPDVQALRLLIANNADGLLVIDRDDVVVFANAAAHRLLRRASEPLVGTEFGHPTVAGEMVEIDVPDAGRIAEMRVSAIEWEGREALLASLRDISERRQAERTQAQLAALVESSDDAIIGVGLDGTIETWNAGASRLYGYERSEAIGLPVAELSVSGEEADRAARNGAVLAGHGGYRVETRDRRKDGTNVDVAITMSPVRDRSGQVVGLARVARDITELKRHERELRFYADRDPLTGLLNRRRLGEELAREVAYVARYPDTAAALIVCDLDNFKYVNDTLGHHAGDQLIRTVARVFQDRVRATDIVARLGGDEFAVLLPHTTVEQAQALAESLRQGVRTAAAQINGRRVRTTLSIGVAPLLTGQPEEEWLAAADIAMYEAKRGGRDRIAAAGAHDDVLAAAHHLGWSERLHDALAEERFELYRQPIVDLATGRTACHELLLRMHEEHRIIEPTAFVSTAERFGIIREIDRWVVSEAIRLLAADPEGSCVYSVNLSGVSLADASLPTLIQRELEAAAVDPHRLIFEFTETAAIADLDAAREFAHALRSPGCATALDDFGSGFGSFAYLKYLPVDYLKIDGAFIRSLPGGVDDRVLVKAIIDVGHGLGKRVIAEHVASGEALELLREYGVDLVQGFHLGRPQPAAGA